MTSAKENVYASRVLVIYTGGTIGMGPKDDRDPTSPLVPRPFEDLLQYLPGIERAPEGKGFVINEGGGIFVEYDDTVFDEPLDSSNVGPRHWVRMAKVIEKRYGEFDGFVILHGTDTMAYTGSGLAFILENLTKPVVLTGSQLPISHIRTDGRNNVINAMLVAGWRAANLPCIPEVVLCFGEKILRAVRSTKSSSSGFHSFVSPNFPELGVIGERIRIRASLLPKSHDIPRDPLKVWDIEKRVIDPGMRVRRVGIEPGFDASWVEDLLHVKHLRGLIFETFGKGNAPTDPAIYEAFRTGVERTYSDDLWPWVVMNIGECQEGSVELGLYDASSGLLEAGVIGGLDMTREAAFAKIHWALASQAQGLLHEALQIAQRGEQSVNVFDMKFAGATVTVDSPYVDSETTARELTHDAVIQEAVVRLRNVRLADQTPGSTVRVHVMVGEPNPGVHCIGDPSVLQRSVELDWQGKPAFLRVDISRLLRRGRIPSALTLGIVVEGEAKLSFDSLYLAISTRARDSIY